MESERGGGDGGREGRGEEGVDTDEIGQKGAG